MAPTEERFSAFLKRYMAEEELTREDMAVGLERSSKTISEWLNDKGPYEVVAKDLRRRLERFRPFWSELRKLREKYR